MAEFDLLLHVCCGPCAEWPARQFMQESVRFLAWFYNPNIHPAAENRRRRENFLDLAGRLGFAAQAELDCDPASWLSWKPEQGSRCLMCYRRRLEAAAAKAAEMNIPAFTTTLLISPYQDHDALRRIGGEAGRKYGVEFLYRDFRPSFRQGQQMAREDGLYRQKYCGCMLSLEESPFKEKIRRDLADLAE